MKGKHFDLMIIRWPHFLHFLVTMLTAALPADVAALGLNAASPATPVCLRSLVATGGSHQ